MFMHGCSVMRENVGDSNIRASGCGRFYVQSTFGSSKQQSDETKRTPLVRTTVVTGKIEIIYSLRHIPVSPHIMGSVHVGE